MRSRSVCR